MDVLFTEQFEQAYDRLTIADKTSVWKAITLLGQDLRYPGLHIKKLEGRKNIWEARPSKRLRITFELTGETIILRNVGEHDKF